MDELKAIAILLYLMDKEKEGMVVSEELKKALFEHIIRMNVKE